MLAITCKYNVCFSYLGIKIFIFSIYTEAIILLETFPIRER